jgi:calcyclin binding protein
MVLINTSTQVYFNNDDYDCKDSKATTEKKNRLVMGDVSQSQERLLDAAAIEEAAANIARPTARMHLEALAKKLKKEGEALERIEKGNASADDQPMDVDEKKVDMDIPVPRPNSERSDSTTLSLPLPPTFVPPPVVMTPSTTPVAKFVPVSTFSFDAGGYNAPFVTVYVPLPGVGSIDRANITCKFASATFDLIVNDLNGKSYRLFQDNLEKDIDPDNCKFIVKSDKVIVKLAKVKQKDYGGYDYWTKLSDKKAREKSAAIKDNPQSSIMDMMKQMYDDGDDNMKKIIGETMMKQQRGELNKDDPMKGLDKMDF